MNRRHDAPLGGRPPLRVGRNPRGVPGRARRLVCAAAAVLACAAGAPLVAGSASAAGGAQATAPTPAPIAASALRAASASVGERASGAAKLVVPTGSGGGPGVYLGGWVNPSGRNCTSNCELGQYPQFEQSVGRPLAILSTYYGWEDLPNVAQLNGIAAAGAVPMVSLHCNTDSGVSVTDAQVNSGSMDDYIAQFAATLAARPYPVMFRWLWEANNTNEGQYAGCINAGTSSAGQGAAGYVEAWQRIWTIFQDEGAANVSFVWTPSGSVNVTYSDPSDLGMDAYYPGDAYVDWAGMDFYEARTKPGSQPSVGPTDYSNGKLTNVAYDDLTALTSKPLILGETAAEAAAAASAGAPGNDDGQAAYLADMAANSQSGRPQVHAVVYFDSVTMMDDWDLTSSGMQGFAQLAATPWFQAVPNVPAPAAACPTTARSVTSGRPTAMVATTDGYCPGYWVATSSGEISTFGSAGFYGDLRTTSLSAPVVAMAATPDFGGYWMLGADGGVFSFGDAGYFGSTGGLRLAAPVVSMAPTPDGGGYWLVAADGGVFSFGDAGFYGSTGGMRLNAPVVGMTSSPDGAGYRLVAADGGVFTFGDAAFLGSAGALRLAAPVIGMTTDPVEGGYRLVASDGGVFDYGASFYGSLGGVHLVAPITSLSPTWLGTGYYLLAGDGGVFGFGTAPYFGRVQG